MMKSEGMKLSLRKNDQVQVIAGRDKGKVGKILSVDLRAGRVIVEKINMVKRHLKPTQKNPGGGIMEKEVSLHYSNVLLFCPKCNRGVRHSRRQVESEGKTLKGKASVAKTKRTKARICKKCGESLDLA